MEINNTEFNYDSDDSDVNNYSEDWNNYLNDCDEWNREDFEYENTLFVNKKKPRVIIPQFLDEDDFGEENKFTILKVNLYKKKKSNNNKPTFRYNNAKIKIFCNSIIKDSGIKTCKRSTCKFAHKFTDIEFCNNECGIEYENNFYTGNCNKRHFRETLYNFVVRKKISLVNFITAEFPFYEKPDSIFLQNLLEICKKINFREVRIKIVKKPEILEF